jgi:DNA-binding transcriptional MocR family regulator
MADEKGEATTRAAATQHSSHRRSSVAEAHAIYLKYHRDLSRLDTEDDDEDDHSGSINKKGLERELLEPPSLTKTAHQQGSSFMQFHRVEKTGVIYATSRASSYGFNPEDSAWANMGQGAPETGPIEGAPSRCFEMTIPDSELEYAPVTGLHELRAKVANYYNHLYRQNKESKYTVDNVCIVPGGRAGLNRIMAVLGQVQVGYFTPDYTAYEQLLGLFARISPSPLLHRDVNEAVMEPEEFEFQLGGRGVGAVLMSNPANPTGQSVEGER